MHRITIFNKRIQRTQETKHAYISHFSNVDIIVHLSQSARNFQRGISLNLYPILNYSLSPDNETSTRHHTQYHPRFNLISSLRDNKQILTINESTRGRKYRRWCTSVPWLTPTRNRRDRSFLRNRVLSAVPP